MEIKIYSFNLIIFFFNYAYDFSFDFPLPKKLNKEIYGVDLAQIN